MKTVSFGATPGRAGGDLRVRRGAICGRAGGDLQARRGRFVGAPGAICGRAGGNLWSRRSATEAHQKGRSKECRSTEPYRTAAFATKSFAKLIRKTPALWRNRKTVWLAVLPLGLLQNFYFFNPDSSCPGWVLE